MLRYEKIESISLFIFFSFLMFSCNPNPKITDSVEKPEIAMRNPIVKKEPRIFRDEIKYHLDSLNSVADLDSLMKAYSEEQLNAILALNRIEKNRLRVNSTIVVPECASAEFKSYSPFPENINFLQCIPKVALISQRVQAFGLYENGELVKWGPVSTGKNSTRTPNGLNYGTYKAKRKISTVDESWIMPYYFNFMNQEGVGTHQYALPGYPASHGCVRMYMDDAKYIYNWANMWDLENKIIERNGTPFMVFGEYDYSSNKPWQNLSQDMKATDLTQDELDTLEDYVNKYQEDSRNFPKDMKDESSEIASI